MKTTKLLIGAISIAAAMAAARANAQNLSATLIDISPGLARQRHPEQRRLFWTIRPV